MAVVERQAGAASDRAPGELIGSVGIVERQATNLDIAGGDNANVGCQVKPCGETCHDRTRRELAHEDRVKSDKAVDESPV
jgi:hypothetical protein